MKHTRPIRESNWDFHISPGTGGWSWKAVIDNSTDGVFLTSNRWYANENGARRALKRFLSDNPGLTAMGVRVNGELWEDGV